MTYPIQALMLGITLALMLGCSSGDSKPGAVTVPPETTASKLELANQAQKEADVAMADYTYARKAEYIALMKQELAVIQTELDRLEAKVDATTGAEKAAAKTQLAAVRTQWTAAQARLDEAEAANESTWNDLKQVFSTSYDALKTSFETTRQWISDTIEP
ncbi:MAG: hypothetical protein H6678_11635 [Candidatus Delongbacteria bacterium]|nr:hypothetical protein [Candidatus Cloacimonadota bacterium]MCB9474454.1 hypothetical protein [Candidatus Delongbacteria bacterium]